MHCCEPGTPGFSFFNLIAELWRGCPNDGAVHRLCSLMRKMGAKTLIQEEIEANEEIIHEFEDIETRIGKKFIEPPQAYRLTFFAASCPDQDWMSLPESSLLGYAIALTADLPPDADVPDYLSASGRLSYLLEAVTRPPGRAYLAKGTEYGFRGVTNYYVHCQRNFDVYVGLMGEQRLLHVEGSLFCQQNALTHACAHAVLKMILNTADLVGHKVTNRELNTILDIDHLERFGGDGLTLDQVWSVINHFGLSQVGGNFLEMPTVDYAEWIYPLVESGYPVFLTFNPTHTRGHVLAVVGHTMNSDKWDCEAHLAYRPEAFGTYHASSAWVDHFIVNDDNFGMYTCMPPQYLRNRILPQYDATQRAQVAFSVLPRGIDVPPYFAEKASVALVARLAQSYNCAPGNKWLGRLWEQLRQPNKGIVGRTLLCTKERYFRHLAGERDSNGCGPVQEIPEELAAAPDHLWLTEISLPDLYTANKHKVGDLLTDAKAGHKTDGAPFSRFVWGWLPGIQVMKDPKAGVSPSPWPLTGHIGILRPGRVLGPDDEW